ncbi:MAG: alkaline phosphatase family protein [Cytophagales bacterium]|nr:alkaline phosphatase family protein [Bernardetiaceae bacterium]MDW8203463.1 alkaline phosphatase family protein [Cytophagales bacterium]
MKKTVVLNVVGLCSSLIGEHTPFLKQWIAHGRAIAIENMLPAVTCPVQATYLTGKHVSQHGIVANGWYDRTDCEVKFWKQSNKLVQAPKIWEQARQKDPHFTVCNLFWWYNMYSSVNYSVTPRPQYWADGTKVPDCYSQPADLRDKLQQQLGTFPLFDFWGPRTSIRSSQWIAQAAKLIEEWYQPTLTLIYLPHLDYNLQRYGTQHPIIAKDLAAIDAVCADLIQFYESRDAAVLLLSEYGITDVNHPIHLNRLFRQQGWLQVRREHHQTELLDAGASKVFAVADHQVAHIYMNEPSLLPQVKQLLEKTPGVEWVLDQAGKVQHHLQHERAGDLVAVADAHSWFTYYYWLDDRHAPDFARLVDIHKKPGYDPVEMFTDPTKPLMPLRIAWKLIQKKLGFRVLMDVIPLDATLIRGSHGRITEQVAHKPILATRHVECLPELPICQPTEVYQLMWKLLNREDS